VASAEWPPLDIEDERTWPHPVRRFVDRHATRLAPVGGYLDEDLALLEEDAQLCELATAGVLAFHCTRLLDHERRAIPQVGLRCLTPDLVTTRIVEARRQGAISKADAARLLQRNVYATGDPSVFGRRDRVGFVVGRCTFDAPSACAPLLETWGGEAIRGGPSTTEALVCGVPTIVVARVDVRGSLMFPGLSCLLVASRLGVRPHYGDYLHGSDVPASNILDIWQPGHPDYDRHIDLPR
jgi:hypothetical protein